MEHGCFCVLLDEGKSMVRARPIQALYRLVNGDVSWPHTYLFSKRGALLLKRFKHYTRPLHNYDTHSQTSSLTQTKIKKAKYKETEYV